jgi:hypothetical protein
VPRKESNRVNMGAGSLSAGRNQHQRSIRKELLAGTSPADRVTTPSEIYKEALRELVEQLRSPLGVIPFVGAGMSAPFHYPSGEASCAPPPRS